MAAKRVESWVVTDEFWQRVEPLVPQRVSAHAQDVCAQAGRGTTAQAGAAGVRGSRVRAAHGLPVEGAAQGALRQCQRRSQALPGMGEGGLLRSAVEGRAWPSTTRWRASPGDGRASTGH